MEQQKYYDKNGEEIKEGMTLVHDKGDKEIVYRSDDGDLGFNADNPDYIHRIPGYKQTLYPLYQFALRTEWEIVKE